MPHILIIGAGTGGLALAHALRKSNANITFAIYERDRTRSDGLFGYRVGISPEGSRCLASCLPDDLFAVFQSTCAVTPDYFNMLTEQYDELLSLDGLSKTSADGIAAEHSVSRMTLRQVLLTGLEDAVHFDKLFTGYTVSDDGSQVTAAFQDGTTATGDLLVGADGTNSRVRKQYLPHAALIDANIRAITAKVDLTAETKTLLAPKMLRGVNLITAPGGDSCIVHVMEFAWDHAGTLKNNIGGNDEALLKAWPGANFDNTRDYILLGFSTHRKTLPDDFASLDGATLHALLRERTAEWHPHLRRLFALSDPTTCFPLTIRTTQRLEAWESSRVTLIGDAIHTMTPGLGVGANTALLDAKILAGNLVRAAAAAAAAAAADGEKENDDADGKKMTNVVEAVADYETQMHSYAWQRVEKSLERFSADDAVFQGGWRGALATMMMRGGMRLVNALPPLKRMFADNMTKERGKIDERA
ncbi:hypothetical protein K4F52_001106 [Lecanicillium sp. MT-2017a]|nr:hypothetical protein K4F52_001106 [Lecanicillium sp. MT-2017a]